MAPFPISRSAAYINLIRRPLSDLIRQLLSLPLTASGEPDYVEADPDLLLSLAESAELRCRSCIAGFPQSACFRPARRSISRTTRPAPGTRPR